MEQSFFFRGYFRVQRNFFNYLWNLKTLILVANIRKDQLISVICESPKRMSLKVCKKSVELWSSVSIYRGLRILKNRYGQLGFESKRILLRKDRKGYAYSSPEGRWAKTQNMGIRHSKCAELALWLQMHYRVRMLFGLLF